VHISVIGTGYVGLVTGVVFSDLGHQVLCVDNNIEKIEGLKQGIMPIYEPGLEEMVGRNVKSRRLTFTTNLKEAVEQSEVVFICVGTPPSESGEPDMRYVRAVATEIAKGLNGYKIIVNKSTVPVGTGDMVAEIIRQNRTEPFDFDVVSNPEFLREGSAISDTLHPDRIVIGASSEKASEKIRRIYEPLEASIFITDVASAEIIKYAANSFLATKISFMNAIANLCEKVGADVTQVIQGVGSDKRIGSAFLNAGLGYGGSCFPKDCLALYHTALKEGYEFDLLYAVMQINKDQPLRFLDRLRDVLGGTFATKRVGLLGLAFKPNTDDVRDAKSLELIAVLLAEGAEVRAYDPIATEKVQPLFPQVTYAESAYEVATGSDALILVTEWNEFKELDMAEVKRLMRTPVLFDGRNIYDAKRLQELGFIYQGVGRAVPLEKA
jgi:UDPglucose 6-dehydrogenase